MSIGFLILFLSLIPALWKRSGIFAILWLLGSGIIAFEYLEVLYSYSVQDFLISFPLPLGVANIGLSKLSAWFGTVFAIGLPLGILYGHFYLKQHPTPGLRSHLFWLGVLGLSMHGLLWMRHTLLFLMLWELMSVSSFFLVMHDRCSSLKAALNYIITMQIGAGFLMSGFGIMYLLTGSFDFATLREIPSLPLYLLLIGFAFKAGFMPLASWLPQAHPVAPAHVSGIMSALMVKTGLYGIITLISLNRFNLKEIAILCLISLVTAFWGVIHAMISTNIKKALAYSTIENIGIIGIGLCVGLLGLDAGNLVMATLGFAGALLHIFFHSLFKALLFYLSGNILCATHSLEADELGSLAKRMPRTALYFLVGVIGISALPLGNGFISELAIYLGLFSAVPGNDLPALVMGIVLLAVMAFVGALALIAFAKLFGIIFLGEARSAKAEAAIETPRGMRIPQFFLVLGILLSGIFGGLGLQFVKPLLRWMGLNMLPLAELQGIYLKLSIVSGIMLLIFALLYLIRRLCVRTNAGATWGCGYQKPSPKMQYNSLAFVHPLSYFLKPFILLKKSYKSAAGLYPIEISYHEEERDPIFGFIVEPASRLLAWFYSLFSRIHNGKTNAYIAWCGGFLIFLLLWVLL
jgi:hydrogenase-4 component B